jgi:hypothetical protein
MLYFSTSCCRRQSRLRWQAVLGLTTLMFRRLAAWLMQTPCTRTLLWQMLVPLRSRTGSLNLRQQVWQQQQVLGPALVVVHLVLLAQGHTGAGGLLHLACTCRQLGYPVSRVRMHTRAQAAGVGKGLMHWVVVARQEAQLTALQQAPAAGAAGVRGH